MNTIDEIQNELKLLRQQHYDLVAKLPPLMSPALIKLQQQIDFVDASIEAKQDELTDAEDARAKELDVKLERDGVEL